MLSDYGGTVAAGNLLGRQIARRVHYGSSRDRIGAYLLAATGPVALARPAGRLVRAVGFTPLLFEVCTASAIARRRNMPVSGFGFQLFLRNTA